MTPTENLERLGLTLPILSAPDGSYVHATRSGSLLFLAGKGAGKYTGKVGKGVSLEQGMEYTCSTTLILLAAIQNEIGTIDKVKHFLKISGFINSAPDFSDHPKVMDACSHLLREIFGARGVHARTSIGVAATPSQIPVEIEAIIEIEE